MMNGIDMKILSPSRPKIEKIAPAHHSSTLKIFAFRQITSRAVQEADTETGR